MSHNFVHGDIVRVGKGKVEYTVAEVQTAPEGSVTVQSNNTGKFSDVEASRLTLLRSADTDPMNDPQVIAQVISEGEDMAREHVRAEIEGDVFDPREDRRQSAYGLAILAQVMRKNPVAGAHNVNPLKSVRGKRVKVRRKVRAQRTALNTLARAYNTARTLRTRGTSRPKTLTTGPDTCNVTGVRSPYPMGGDT